MARLVEFGEQASGIVCDENDWGGRYPKAVRPARRATGAVVGVFPMAPDVVKIQTAGDEILVVRTDR